MINFAKLRSCWFLLFFILLSGLTKIVQKHILRLYMCFIGSSLDVVNQIFLLIFLFENRLVFTQYGAQIRETGCATIDCEKVDFSIESLGCVYPDFNVTSIRHQCRLGYSQRPPVQKCLECPLKCGPQGMMNLAHLLLLMKTLLSV